jgi:chromosome segregation ATPase
MTALRRDYAELSSEDRRIVEFKGAPAPIDALRSVLNRGKPSYDADLQRALDIVAKAAHTIDEMATRSKASEEAAARSIAECKSQRDAAQHDAECFRVKIDTLKQRNEKLAFEAERRVSELEEKLDADHQMLEERTNELDIAKQWIAHFQAQVTNLLVDAPMKLEACLPSSSSNTEAIEDDLALEVAKTAAATVGERAAPRASGATLTLAAETVERSSGFWRSPAPRR